MNKRNFKDYFNYFYLVCVLKRQHVRVCYVLPPMWVSEIDSDSQAWQQATVAISLGQIVLN